MDFEAFTNVGAHLWGMGAIAVAGVGGFVLSRLFLRNYRDRSILSEIFDGSNSARLVTDIQDRVVFYNPAFDDLRQTEDGKSSLQTIRELFAKSGNEETIERLESVIFNARRGHEDSMEAETQSETGERKWYRLSAQPVAGWLGTIHWRIDDITERRAVESVIRAEREKLVDFTDHAPVGFYSMDENGRFTFVNATLARWLGSDIDSLLQGGLLHTYMETPPGNARPFDILEKGGPRQMAEVKMKGPGGRTFTASINQSVVQDSNGQTRVRGVVHDLTSEREMRQALKDSEDRFRRFFEEAPLGIAMMDLQGVTTDSNLRFAQMMNCEQDHLDGKVFEDLVAPAYKDIVKDVISDIRHKKPNPAPVDVDLLSPCSGETVSVQFFASPFKGDSIAIQLFDRSEQKSLEAQMNQSQKMQAVGQLAGGVAHDFNNLLTAIIGFCDLLLLRHKAGDPSFNDIMQIKQNSNRAANLVRQLLAFSRQQKLNPKVLDVTETLTELSHLMRRLIGVQIDLDLVHGTNLNPVKVDEGQFEQVMINLVVNARDAMGGKGSLCVQTENVVLDKARPVMNEVIPAGEWVAIHVKDTGSGIDPANLQRIFEPFFTTKKIGEGTGLGLATVYGIVRQTGGFVDVDSEVGKGTTFSIYLPRYVETAEDKKITTDKKEKDNQDLTGTATILLVEDEDAVRMFSSRALSNKGYEVLEADCGESALDVIEDYDGKIDLLITDVIMPEMDGPTLAKKILETHEGLPVIFVSGYTEEKFKEELGENAHFLPKPFTLEQLAKKVKDVLG